MARVDSTVTVTTTIRVKRSVSLLRGNTAEIASAALGIVLTKRGKHLGQDIGMCGVPIHAANDYLNKLVNSRFTRKDRLAQK